MKLCILSDARIATSPNIAGHGLGQIVYAVATGLAAKGHTVTLLAAPGSEFAAGKLITFSDEREFLRHDLTQYDAIIDNTHQHVTGAIKGLPTIQVSHDREAKPTAQATFPSAAHRQWHGFNDQSGRIVHNGVKLPELSVFGRRRGGYVAYLSTFYREKQPNAAFEAARLAGLPLHMAGPTPPAPPPGANYWGPLWGRDKLEFLYHADALIFPASTECAPVTVLEAQSVGTPVIVSSLGGSHENMSPDVTGFVCTDILEMSEALCRAYELSRAACRRWIADNRSEQQMIDGYEALIGQVAGGERW